jgi:hypothetical protein
MAAAPLVEAPSGRHIGALVEPATERLKATSTDRAASINIHSRSLTVTVRPGFGVSGDWNLDVERTERLTVRRIGVSGAQDAA